MNKENIPQNTDRSQWLKLSINERIWPFDPDNEELYRKQLTEAFSRTSPEFEGLDWFETWRILEEKYPGWHIETREICGNLSYMPTEILYFVINLCQNFIEIRNELQNPNSDLQSHSTGNISK